MPAISWVCVGCNDAASDGLRYAARAAATVHAHLAQTFGVPDLEAAHPLTGSDQVLATGHAVAAAQASNSATAASTALLAVPAGLDCLVFYFAGHGHGGTAPALQLHGGQCLSSAHLDTLLSSINARALVVILDCCFAGAISAALTKVRASADSRRATLIASAGTRDQKAWEDDQLQMPVFTLFLLQALRSESLSQPGDLAATVLDAARDVAAFAAQRKGAEQTPVVWSHATAQVSIGRSAQVLVLPPTFRQSLRVVLMRVVRRTAIALILLMALLQAVTYHMRLSANGYIEVVQGPRFLSGAVPPLLAPVRESLWHASAFLGADARALLVQEGVAGIRTGLDEDGFERWLQGVWQLTGETVNLEVQRLRLSLGIDLEGSVAEDNLPQRLQSLYESAARFESGYAWVLQLEAERALLAGRTSEFEGFGWIDDLLQNACAEFEPDEWANMSLRHSVGKYPTDGLRPWVEGFQYILATSGDQALPRLAGVLRFLNLR